MLTRIGTIVALIAVAAAGCGKGRDSQDAASMEAGVGTPVRQEALDVAGRAAGAVVEPPATAPADRRAESVAARGMAGKVARAAWSGARAARPGKVVRAASPGAAAGGRCWRRQRQCRPGRRRRIDLRQPRSAVLSRGRRRHMPERALRRPLRIADLRGADRREWRRRGAGGAGRCHPPASAISAVGSSADQPRGGLQARHGREPVSFDRARGRGDGGAAHARARSPPRLAARKGHGRTRGQLPHPRGSGARARDQRDDQLG